MNKRIQKTGWSVLVTALTVLLGGVSASAQTQLNLETSFSDFYVTGGGAGSAAISLALQNRSSVTFTNGNGQSVTCNAGAGGFLFACASASGSGALFSTSNTSGAAYFFISTPSQTPLSLQALGGGIYSIHQTAPLNFSFSSPQGTLTGTIDLSKVVMAISNTAHGVGRLTVTGGTFASAFPSEIGAVNLTFALGADLRTIVGTGLTLTGQVEYPSDIEPETANPNDCGDFMTGGGSMSNDNAVGGDSNNADDGENDGGNKKAEFAISGGCKQSQSWGHFKYTDHRSGMHVEGTPDPSCAVAYSKTSGTCRHLRGSANINGKGGYTYDAVACDNSGAGDSLAVKFSNGYSNSGNVSGGEDEGGNIQVHQGDKEFCNGGDACVDDHDADDDKDQNHQHTDGNQNHQHSDGDQNHQHADGDNNNNNNNNQNSGGGDGGKS